MFAIKPKLSSVGLLIWAVLLSASGCSDGNSDNSPAVKDAGGPSSDISDDDAGDNGHDSQVGEAGSAAPDSLGTTQPDASSDESGDTFKHADAAMPGGPVAPSEEVSKIIDDIADYLSWGTFVENSELMESQGHAPGGNPMHVITYRNDIVAEAEVEGTLPLPEGSLIVKENYAALEDEMPMALTVMAKTGPNWFWLQITPDGLVMTEPDGTPRAGDVPGCISCHSQAADNDYVFLHDFSEPVPEGTLPPSKEAQSIIDQMQNYTEWGTFAENSELMVSQGHAPGGKPMQVLTYRNETVARAEQAGTLPLPEGSIIVKENYASPQDELPTVLTVMAKTAEEWFWIKMTPGGRVLTDPEGKAIEGTDVATCKSCHSAAAENDYIFLHDFSSPSNNGADAGAPNESDSGVHGQADAG